MDIHVFKTSINSMELMIELEKKINSTQSIISWSVDIEDIDNVLFIKSNNLKEQNIIETVESEGFRREPLPD
jgi:hypothetical protein